MSIWGLLNWDDLLPQYTEKEREEILHELKKKAIQRQETEE